jgi:hypothetical protein
VVNDVKSDEMVERDPKREDSEVGIVEGRLTSGILEGFIVLSVALAGTEEGLK